MSLANLDYEVRSGLRSILNLDSSLSKQDPTLNRKYLHELAFEVLSLQLLKNKCSQQKKKNLISSAVGIISKSTSFSIPGFIDFDKKSSLQYGFDIISWS